MKHILYLALLFAPVLTLICNPVSHNPANADDFHKITSKAYHTKQHPNDPYDHGPNDLKASYRKGVTQGYYLGFRSLADEMRDLRRPSNIPVTTGFLKTLYLDVHYMNQEFNGRFFINVLVDFIFFS